MLKTGVCYKLSTLFTTEKAFAVCHVYLITQVTELISGCSGSDPRPISLLQYVRHPARSAAKLYLLCPTGVWPWV